MTVTIVDANSSNPQVGDMVAGELPLEINVESPCDRGAHKASTILEFDNGNSLTKRPAP